MAHRENRIKKIAVGTIAATLIFSSASMARETLHSPKSAVTIKKKKSNKYLKILIKKYGKELYKTIGSEQLARPYGRMMRVF